MDRCSKLRRVRPTGTDRALHCCAALSRIYERCANGVEIAWPDGPTTNRVRKANKLLYRLIRAAGRLWHTGLAADRAVMLAWCEQWRNYRDELGWDFAETRPEMAARDWEHVEQLAFGDL